MNPKMYMFFYKQLKPVQNILPVSHTGFFSCIHLFYISHDGFDRLLHQGDIQPVPNLHPPAGGGLNFRFQRVCEVLHLGFHHLLDVIQIDGLDGCFGFALGKAYDGIGDGFLDFFTVHGHFSSTLYQTFLKESGILHAFLAKSVASLSPLAPQPQPPTEAQAATSNPATMIFLIFEVTIIIMPFQKNQYHWTFGYLINSPIFRGKMFIQDWYNPVVIILFTIRI